MSNIITISGDPGSGKTTTRMALKNYFEERGKTVVIYSVGEIFRELAEKKGMTVTEFNQFLEDTKCDVDQILDSTVKKYGSQIIKENDDNKVYIVDSRLAWHTIPESFKVRLTINDKIAGKRIFGDMTRGKEDRYQTLEEAINSTRARRISETERYIKIYGPEADISNSDNFDINIDTSYATIEDIVNVIVDNMERKKQGKEVLKIWVSPKTSSLMQDDER